MDRSVEIASARNDKSFRFMSPMLLGALIAGVLVHLAGFLVFRVASNPLPTRDQSAGFVRYVSASSLAGDLALEEQAQLFDSAPLFVPTQWNAAQSVSLMPRDRVRARFSEFEPVIDLVRELRPVSLSVGDEGGVSKPADLLKSRFWVFFEGFGQAREVIVPFPSIGHFAEVVVIGAEDEGALLIESPLKFTDTSVVPEPVSLLLRISSGGVYIGGAVISRSSGNVEFDRAAQNWLRLPETLGQLPAGYLDIKVYP